MQIYRFDDDTPSVVLKEIVGEREPFIFDPMKNLLNGDNFEFQFSGKKFIIA